MRQLRRWKRLDEGHWHAHTRGLPWGLSKDGGTVQQVHCSRGRLFRTGLEFYACTINKSAHTKKVWKLTFAPRTFSLRIFTFVSHAQIITSAISLICCLNYLYICFSPNFVFLDFFIVVFFLFDFKSFLLIFLLLALLIRLSLYFLCILQAPELYSYPKRWLAGAVEYTDCISADVRALQRVSWIWY